MKPTLLAKPNAARAALLSLALIATIPIFFEIFREAAFNTVPRDDYASYLLALAGQGGQFPGSPYAYRILSVLAALPFYLPPAALPLYQPGQPRSGRIEGRRSAGDGFLSIHPPDGGGSLLDGPKALPGLASSASILAGLAALVLSDHISRPGIDPLAVLLIACLFYAFDRPVLFSVLVLLSAGFNEKIPFIFAVLALSRWVWRRWFARNQGLPGVGLQLAAACLSLLAYFAARAILRLPGFEGQADPLSFFPHLAATMGYLFSLKGLVLNLIPILVLFTLAGLSASSGHAAGCPYALADVACAFVLLGLALGTDLQFTVGRVVMYAYPLYLPGVAFLFDRLAARHG